ncbi:MAG TPA: GNAT family N-acetyltransferase [Nocardioidaceae bacterium]|nr:GNAT family N-acetyltransferase [Nocardioidaceae bacterium]
MRADDARTVAEVVQLRNAVIKVDSPWEHPMTATVQVGAMRHGWDGEPPRCFVGHQDGRLVVYGELSVSDWDNTHLAWVDVMVHPNRHRQGLGSDLLRHLMDEARRLGRTSAGMAGWESAACRGFARAHGFEQRSQSIMRRQQLSEVDPAELARWYDEATAHASAYELVRLAGATPPDLLDAVATLTAAINDAPQDDLDVEDEVFTAERVRAYEHANAGRRTTGYRLLARHRGTGALAGQTVVAVERERPEIGHQHDTSVVREHRGHRLGLLLKAGMLRWLGEVEPQLRSLDTWNAETNGPMIAVNERLGYRVLGRALQFQRSLSG